MENNFFFLMFKKLFFNLQQRQTETLSWNFNKEKILKLINNLLQYVFFSFPLINNQTKK